MLGAAWIAERALLPAIGASRNGRLVAIASRDGRRAQALARPHSAAAARRTYEEVLFDPRVEAVYVPLVNSLHLPWTLRALAAGKHVLCEKPLALDARQGEAMADAAGRAGKLLMEALMYRFHPRLMRLRARVGEGARFVHAAFGFPLAGSANYRLDPALGGGALLDTGSYVISAARWFLGEPDRVAATARMGRGVDMSVMVGLGFPGGGEASLWAALDSPEHQRLEVVTARRTHRPRAPAFTSWRDPHDPYQLMVEAFAEAVLEGAPAPLPAQDAVGNLRVIDAVREAAGMPFPPGAAGLSGPGATAPSGRRPS
ncbi:MAG: Gfo/Idh/MocA family protein [Candidatus Dormibacterales bacterium]